MNEEIKFCLNCSARHCNGQYPHCEGKEPDTYFFNGTISRSFNYGDATKEVCRLANMGWNRKMISQEYKISSSHVYSLLKNGVSKGYITPDVVENTKMRKNQYA